MHIIENRLNTANDLLPQSKYFTNLKGAVIDIETAGLSPFKDPVFLIGILYRDEQGLKITQFLASNYDEEDVILTAFFDLIKDFDIILSYNGASFDIPFINKRSKILGLNKSLELFRTIDYLKIFKASYLPELLKDMKLKTVEKYAGVFRTDKISGKQCISMYSDFINKNDLKAGKMVVFHNFEDLSRFPDLNKLIRKIDLHNALFHVGFPIKSGDFTWFIQNIKPGPDILKIRGISPNLNVDQAIYEEDFTLTSNSITGEFYMEIFNHQLNSKQLTNKRIINYFIIEKISSIRL